MLRRLSVRSSSTRLSSSSNPVRVVVGGGGEREGRREGRERKEKGRGNRGRVEMKKGWE